MLVNVIILITAALVVHWRFRTDFDQGLGTAVFLLLLLPNEVRIELPGAIPELTGHRLVLLLVLFHAASGINRTSLQSVSWLVRLLSLIAACRIATTFFTALSFGASFKVVLAFLVEVFLFFVMIFASLRTRRAMEAVIWSSVSALFTIACIGAVEKYTGRNIPAMFIPNMVDNGISVTATFRHRILL